MNSFVSKIAKMLALHFQYVPLDRVERNIRLLQRNSIAPDDGCLSYTLESWDIDACPPFYALSYVWGTDEPTNEIKLDGKPFLVRDNLLVALYELSGCKIHDDVGRIWIDAVCINQHDFVEKGYQVNLMGDVYTTAVAVISWLGTAANDSDSVMERLECLWAAGERASIFDHRFDAVTQDMAISAFVKRMYFYRAWTVQEFILPKDLWIMCGSYILPWSHLEPIANANGMMRSRSVSREFPREGARRGLPLPFPFGSSGCQDPRDRIYALLGLARAHNNALGNLEADYMTDHKTLFFRTTRHVRDAPHSYNTLEPWFRQFDVFVTELCGALDLP